MGENKGNPNPSPATRFGAGIQDSKRNPGGRTPTKWLRDLLDAAHDKSPEGVTNRQAIGLHLIEVATSWTVKIKGRGEEAYEVADAKDSIEAAKILCAYDMGKPVEALEVSNPDGSLARPKVVAYLPANGRGPLMAQTKEPEPEQPQPEQPDDGPGST